MKKFFAVHNRDAGDAYIRALLDAGYEEVNTLKESDFILTDFERPMVMGTDKPMFIYPHTPYAFWLWDKWIVASPVECNFVCAEAGVRAMQAYGYKYRVESVGFSR